MPAQLETSDQRSEEERRNESRLRELLRRAPIPQGDFGDNLALFTRRQILARTLQFAELYRRIVGVHGVVMEFGVRWGRDLATLISLRGIYEPFNHNRKIVGFDTFAGFPAVSDEDGGGSDAREGGYGVTEGYADFLRQLLRCHENESPIAHLEKFELVEGDVTETLEEWLDRHPEAIVAMAYFDLDLYEPTRRCLELLRDRLPKGAIVAFDELNCPTFPGETTALREVFGLSGIRLRRSPINSMPSWFRIGD